MASKRIPILAKDLEDDQDYAQNIRLDGVEYRLRIYYVEMDDCYYMSLSKSGVDLMMGRRIVAGMDLLAQSRTEEYPKGEIRVKDLDADENNKTREPNGENFGKRVILEYIEAA